jgi:hypothetical protein
MDRTVSSPGKGEAPFSPGPPLDFLPLGRALEVMKFFIMMHSLSLCLIGYAWCRQAASRSFSMWYVRCRFWRLKSHLAATTHCSLEPSASLSSSLKQVVSATRWGHHFCPLLPPFVPFVVPWLVALDGAQQLQLGAIFPSPWTKMTPTSSSPVACWAVISSSSFGSGPSGLRLRPCWSCRPPRREFHAQGLDYASSSPRCAWLHARSLGRLPGQLEGPWTGVKTSEDVVPATGGSVAALCRWPLGRPRLKINIFAWRWREFSACCASVMLRISSSQ